MHTSRHTFGRKSSTAKTRKLHPSVDLTAMVNLSFLLILFFMLQSFMKKPEHMDLTMPKKTTCLDRNIICDYGSWRNLTLLLGENDKVVSYMGITETPFEKPKTFQSGSLALQNEISSKCNFVHERVSNPEKEGLFIIIKPSDKCNYENLIAALDQVNLNHVRGFTVSHQINPAEQKLLEK